MQNPLNIFGRQRWKAKMSNDAIFIIETSPIATREDAMIKLMDAINLHDDLPIYERKDVISLYKVKQDA